MRSWLLSNTMYGTWLPGSSRGSVTSVRDLRPGEEPTPFPKGVLLKVALDGRKRLRLYQGGRQLRADRNGIYSVAFDARELVVKGGL